jgi:hypothetical protein
MANDNPHAFYADILDKVKTILALSGLVVLLAGAGLTAVIWNMPKENQFSTWFVMLGFLLAVILMNMLYAHRTQQQELILGIHVARKEKGVEQECDGATVTLFRNGTAVQEAATNDKGYFSFPVKLNKKDNLYVIVVDTFTGRQSGKAILYSAGQFNMTKKIVL